MKLAWNRRRFFEKAAFGSINTKFYFALANIKTSNHN